MAVPATESVLVLHAVLSPAAPVQHVLLERSWSGHRPVVRAGIPYSAEDPITTGSGIAEIDAVVDVFMPDGEARRASEPRRENASGVPAGVYVLPVTADEVAAGGRFLLRVRTTNGDELSAATRAPVAPTVPPRQVRVVDRVRDTVTLAWAAVTQARAYQVRIETPFGPYTIFADRAALRLTGGLRNPSVEGVPRVFIPGFRQNITVSAVDSNFYDFFRTQNNQYTGSGLLSNVDGGIGVFGALVPVARHEFGVVAPFTDPIEGRWRFDGTSEDSARTLVIAMTLYLEARGSGSQPDALSGDYRVRPGSIALGDSLGSLVGIRFADSVRIAYLRQQALADTVEVFRAAVRGDSLIGRYRARLGAWRFVRQVP